jgi:glycosyltransferase involved in cell wall biosynthesis
LYVLPSLAEGISNTILEAMATGLPVVATNVGGNPELVRAGHTGQLVPRGDPQAMAQAMLQYFSDLPECRKQGREARNVAVSCFSMSNMVSRYVDLYDRMLEGKKS